MRALILTVVILGIVATLYHVSSDLPDEAPLARREDDRTELADEAESTGPAPRRVPDVFEPETHADGGRVMDSPQPLPDDETVATFDDLIVELGRLFREKSAVKSEGRAQDDRDARRAARKARRAVGHDLSRVRSELTRMLEVDPGLAPRIIAELDRSADDDAALALGSLLGRVRDGKTVRALRERAVDAPSPVQRRAALRGLAGRDASVWFEPASRLYRDDPDPVVRDDSATFLGNTLVDPLHRDSHDRVRELLASGLEDPDPRQRRRSLRGFLFDRSGSPISLAAARLALDDEDASVRTEAERVLRVIDRR